MFWVILGVMSDTRVARGAKSMGSEAGGSEAMEAKAGGVNSRGASAMQIIDRTIQAVVGDEADLLTESEKNQKLLEMLVPKSRRKTYIAVPKTETPMTQRQGK